MTSDMNERDELARLLPELVDRELPSGRQRQLREFVMNQIQQDRPKPRRRLVLTTSAAVAAAAAVAVGVVAVGTGGPGGPSPLPIGDEPTSAALSPVAQTFELAAVYAAAQPFTPPRPDQWIYIKNHNTADGSIEHDKGQEPDVTDEVWTRADGKQMGRFNEITGRLETWDQQSDYPALCLLPTDPMALVALLRSQLEAPTDGLRSGPVPAFGNVTSTPDELDGLLFLRIARILDGNLLPPAVTAALWRALALVPGVTESPTPIDVDGRPVTAAGRVIDGWRFEQLLLDPDTHEFVGYRSVAVKDYMYGDGPNGPIAIKQGEVQYTITRVAAAVVDAVGQTG